MITYALDALSNCLILTNTQGDFDDLLARFGGYGMEADDEKILYLMATDAYFVFKKPQLILTNGNEVFFHYELNQQDDFNDVESVLLINADKPIHQTHIHHLIQQNTASHASEFLEELEMLVGCYAEGFIIGFYA